MSETTVGSSEPGPKPKASQWLWTALVASLALNLLMMGAIGGTLWRFRHGGGQQFGPAFAGPSVLRHLPPDRREALRGVISKYRDFRWQNWRALKVARDDAGKALVADPFDPKALEDKWRTMQHGELSMRDDFIPLLVDIAKELTLAERRDLLRQLRRGDEHGRRPPS